MESVYMHPNLRNRIFKVIPAEELERHTETGWEILESHIQHDIAEIPAEDQVEHSSQQTTYYPPGHFQRHGPHIRHGYKPVPVHRLYYTVHTDREKVLVDLRAANERLSHQVLSFDHEQERVAREHKEAIEESEKKLVEEHDQLERVRRQRGRMESQRDGQIDRNRKLERDIGKLRVAIGDIKFNEIVGTNNQEDEDEDVDDDEAMD
jgi:hypothetical protein